MNKDDEVQFDQVVADFFAKYQDRGMKKWGGFYLSDHVAKIEQMKANTNSDPIHKSVY